MINTDYNQFWAQTAAEAACLAWCLGFNLARRADCPEAGEARRDLMLDEAQYCANAAYANMLDDIEGDDEMSYTAEELAKECEREAALRRGVYQRLAEKYSNGIMTATQQRRISMMEELAKRLRGDALAEGGDMFADDEATMEGGQPREVNGDGRN